MSKLSNLAESLVGSEIVKLGNAVSDRIRLGNEILNYTIGDFSSSVFPIPKELEEAVIQSYKKGHTNYPPAAGVGTLIKAVCSFIKDEENIDYREDEIQIASGGRPLIYSLFKTVINPGDKVIYAIPSWNNNHYTHLNDGKKCEIITLPGNDFMPTADSIEPHIKGAALLCLCTPQNPTGTVLEHSEMEKICNLVIQENKSRAEGEKKLYVLFDQMYWLLTYGTTKHCHPVTLNPEMKKYTITVDGISKVFAATGVRVGWSLGPADVIAKMKALLSHVGAWAPMAEQIAVADFLNNRSAIATFLKPFKKNLEERLWLIHDGFKTLKNNGYPIDVIAPKAAIYLTVKIDLKGKTHAGKILSKQSDVTEFLLNEAELALVPFVCFGSDSEFPWYRISVGTCKIEDIKKMFQKLTSALSQLS